MVSLDGLLQMYEEELEITGDPKLALLAIYDYGYAAAFDRYAYGEGETR